MVRLPFIALATLLLCAISESGKTSEHVHWSEFFISWKLHSIQFQWLFCISSVHVRSILVYVSHHSQLTRFFFLFHQIEFIFNLIFISDTLGHIKSVPSHQIVAFQLTDCLIWDLTTTSLTCNGNKRIDKYFIIAIRFVGSWSETLHCMEMKLNIHTVKLSHRHR